MSASLLQRVGRLEYLLDLFRNAFGNAATNPNPPGTPGYNPAWYALTDIYWDPVAGSNSNTGATIGSPLLTFAEIVRRYGSTSPQFNPGQSVTIHKLSGQPNPLTDPVFFTPKVTAGGQAILLDTPVVVATFAAGTVTPRNRTAGTLLHIANLPGSAAKNRLVFNSTRGSYAFIDSMSGSTAFMQQPITSSVVNTIGVPSVSSEAAAEDNTWATGDTLVLMQCQALNLKLWAPIGGDVSASGQVCAGWVQFSRVVDTSGGSLSSFLFFANAYNVMSMCQIDTQVVASASFGLSGGLFLVGCTVAGSFVCLASTSTVFAGGYASSFFVGGQTGLGGDAVLHGNAAFFGGPAISVQSFYCDGVIDLETCEMQCLLPGSALWGSALMAVGGQGIFQVSGGAGNTFTDALLITGQISFGGVVVGWPSAGSANQGGTFTLNGTNQVTVNGLFPANAPIAISLATVGGTPGTSAPYFSQAQIANSFFIKSPTTGANDTYNWQAVPAPIALTPANMTLYRGLQEPATGARFTVES